MYLFRLAVEVKHMEGTQLPPDCAGACVGVYLRAETIRDAIDAAESELYEELYYPIRTYEALQLDVEDLSEANDEHQEEGDPTILDLINILNNGGVWFTAFKLYPPEEQEIQ